MSGGEGSIIGTMFGLFLLTVMSNAAIFVGLSALWEEAISGVVLVVAIDSTPSWSPYGEGQLSAKSSKRDERTPGNAFKLTARAWTTSPSRPAHLTSRQHPQLSSTERSPCPAHSSAAGTFSEEPPHIRANQGGNEMTDHETTFSGDGTASAGRQPARHTRRDFIKTASLGAAATAAAGGFLADMFAGGASPAAASELSSLLSGNGKKYYLVTGNIGDPFYIQVRAGFAAIDKLFGFSSTVVGTSNTDISVIVSDIADLDSSQRHVRAHGPGPRGECVWPGLQASGRRRRTRLERP